MDQENSPVQAPINPTPPPQLPHKHLHPAVWIGILVAVATVVGYAVWANSVKDQVAEQNNTNQTASPNVLSDWKTYRNEEYGYEFKYPATMTELELNVDSPSITFGDLEYCKNADGICAAPSIRITVHENKEGMTTDTWFNHNSSRNNWGKVRVKNIAGQSAIVANHANTDSFETIYIVGNEAKTRIFEISLAGLEFDQDKFLPMFKFIDSLVDFEKIKAGDTFGEMVVVSTESVRENINLPISENIVIRFEGAVEIKGKYVYYGEDSFGGSRVCFSDLDAQSASKMPQLKRGGINQFCFENDQYAMELFAPEGSSGTATIVIDNYTLIYYPSEGWNTAKLIRVVTE